MLKYIPLTTANAKCWFQVLKNIRSCNCLPFSQLILAGLDLDCLDICSKLLHLNPGYAHFCLLYMLSYSLNFLYVSVYFWTFFHFVAVERLSVDEFYWHSFVQRKVMRRWQQYQHSFHGVSIAAVFRDTKIINRSQCHWCCITCIYKVI